MVDWDQLIEIKLSNTNIKHLRDKGYNVDQYKIRKIHPSGMKSTRWCIPQGTTILIPLYDLSENSSYKIKIVCDYCGETFYSTFNSYKTRLKQSLTKRDACKKCIPAKKADSAVFDKFEDAKQMFKKKNCILLGEQEFVKSRNILYFRCNNHPNEVQHVIYHNIKRGQQMCKYCGVKQSGDVRRIPFEVVKQSFENRGYKLLSKEYISCDEHLEYLCPHHPDVIQKIDYYHLSKRGQGCNLCAMEAKCGENHHNWKGGISPLHNYLRDTAILQWKKDTLLKYGYKCAITGNQSFVVHHLYGFNKILKELIDYFKKDYNLNLRGIKIEDLSEEQLKVASNKCLELHYDHGLGIVLDKNIHKLFHHYYKYGNNTPSQFEEFRQRYLAGEFNDQLAL